MSKPYCSEQFYWVMSHVSLQWNPEPKHCKEGSNQVLLGGAFPKSLPFFCTPNTGFFGNFYFIGSTPSSVGLGLRFWEAIYPSLQPFLQQWPPLLVLNHPWIDWSPYNMEIATPCSSPPRSPGYNGTLPTSLVQVSHRGRTTCSRCPRCWTPGEKASFREFGLNFTLSTL